MAVFKNLFSFLFQRAPRRSTSPGTSSASTTAERPLDEILQDKYVQNRLTPEQQRRLLDRPEIIEAISGDMRRVGEGLHPS